MSHRLVLIVEDSREVASNLQIACSSIEGVEVEVAIEAEQAWQLLARSVPEDRVVIVTDIQLPDTDGFDLIRRIREDARFARTPVIAVSANEDPSFAERLARFGVKAFYPKPYSPMRLKSHLEALLNGSAAP
ncbi:MAG: response regulator [Bryobacterales bacterium]|nr:response regulator [Bryobacterales bacterium]